MSVEMEAGKAGFNARMAFLAPFVVVLALAVLVTALITIGMSGHFSAREKAITQAAYSEIARANEGRLPENIACDPPADLRTSGLCAQWKAADAARDGANWALFSLIFGIPTVALLWLTFRETRRSASAALRSVTSAVQSERAWLIIRPNPGQYISNGYKDGAEIHGMHTVGFEVENIGRTPALEAVVRIKVEAVTAKKLAAAGLSARAIGRPYDAIGPSQIVKITYPFIENDGDGRFNLMFPKIEVSIEYKDIFARNTIRVFDCTYVLIYEAIDGADHDMAMSIRLSRTGEWRMT